MYVVESYSNITERGMEGNRSRKWIYQLSDMRSAYLCVSSSSEIDILFNDPRLRSFLDTQSVCLEGRMNMFYLTTHSTHFIYSYMESDKCLSERRNPLQQLHCLLFRLTARVLLYAPFHIHDSPYHGLCYTSHGALAATRNSSMRPP